MHFINVGTKTDQLLVDKIDVWTHMRMDIYSQLNSGLWLEKSASAVILAWKLRYPLWAIGGQMRFKLIWSSSGCCFKLLLHMYVCLHKQCTWTHRHTDKKYPMTFYFLFCSTHTHMGLLNWVETRNLRWTKTAHYLLQRTMDAIVFFKT